MKEYFNKEIAMTSEDDEGDKNFTTLVCDKFYVDSNVKVIDHCQITGKNRGSAHRDCTIKDKVKHKIPIVFCNLNNHDSRFIMQELGKFDFKINVIPNVLEKNMIFDINNKLVFVEIIQF